mgnify:CR=1 FL=1
MAKKSDFLPFQDSDGDGLIDICEDLIDVEEPTYCPECIPNPIASVPNWRNRKRYEPFLNEKNCRYQITIVAKDYTTTGASEDASEKEAEEALKKIYQEYEQTPGWLHAPSRDLNCFIRCL